MNKKLLFWAFNVSLGGFLFGMDTAVISGAEQAIKNYWQLSKYMHGFTIAVALYGTIVGAALGGFPADKYGRKPTLMAVGVFFFVSALGTALVSELWSFIALRFIGGICIGASSVVAPVYISEIAPSQYRGRMVAAFQFNIVLGILIAYLSNYLLAGNPATDWRYMLGIVCVPSLVFCLLLLNTPESPRWLILHANKPDQAKEILSITEANPSEKFTEIVQSAQSEKHTEALFNKKYFKPLLLAFGIAFFNQWSGINAIIYYAPRIFNMTGLGQQQALLSTAGIGVINLLFTCLGWSLIDHYGRRSLLLLGSIAMAIVMLACSWAFYTETYGMVPWCIFGFIATFAVSQGAVIWVYISEIFPTKVRAKGMAWGSLTHWVFAALITNVFPIMAESLGGGPIFLFFGLTMVAHWVFSKYFMPETKGVSLEELQEKLMIQKRNNAKHLYTLVP
jgi:MFS transporter, SP family, arabinose:H+ symporter